MTILPSILLTTLFFIQGNNQGFSQTLSDSDNGTYQRYMQYVDSAEICIKDKNWKNAEINLINAIKENPADKGNVMLWSNLGVVRSHLEDYTGAIEAYDIALSRAPKSVVLLSNKGAALIAAKHYDMALETLSKAIEIDSLLKRPRLHRAMIAMLNNDIKLAREDYGFILRHDSICDQALAGMSECLLQEGDLVSAERMIDKAISYKNEEEYYCIASYIKANLDKLSEARRIVMEGIKAYPESGNLYLHLSYINRLSHLNNEAESAYNTALRLGVDKETAIKLNLNGLKKRQKF